MDEIKVLYRAKDPYTNEEMEVELAAWQVIKIPEGSLFIDALTNTKDNYFHIPQCVSQSVLVGIEEYVKIKR